MVSSDRGGDLGTPLLEAPQVAHPERAGKRQWQGREMIWLLLILWWLIGRQTLINMRLIPGRAIGRYRF